MRNHTSKLHQIFLSDCRWPWLGSPLSAWQYVVYSRFCGDVIFYYNWSYGTGNRNRACIKSNSPQGITGLEKESWCLWLPSWHYWLCIFAYYYFFAWYSEVIFSSLPNTKLVLDSATKAELI